MKTKKKSNILLTEGGVSGLGSCRVSGLVQSQKCGATHFCELSRRIQFCTALEEEAQSHYFT
jgi:hypothetical protein